jgi:hypothetical protein
MSDTEDNIINNANTNTNNNNNTNKDIEPNVEWCSQHEDILVEWADKAICYKWLHSQSHNIYSFRSRWFTIPVIIMSTLTGTANFAQERIHIDYQPIYTVIIGSINIFAGIITTIQQFLKINELNESHRVSSISWDKFYRNIKLELAKSRVERMPAFQMLKMSKEEFDRLMETSPSIDKKVILQFNKKFTEDTEIQNKIHKPEICDALESTRNFLYAETIEDKEKNKTKDIVKYAKENNEFKRKSVTVTNFISDFNKEFKREPTISEIHDNLKDNVSDNIINTVIDIEGNTKKNGFNL